MSALRVGLALLFLPAIEAISEGAPTISIQPTSISVNAGGGESFSVTANGTGTLNYQWYHFGFPIPGATAQSYFPVTSPNYETQPIDTGAYSVLVTDSNGSTNSNEADFSVGSNLGLIASDIDFESFSPGGGMLAPWFLTSEFGSALVAVGSNDPITGVLPSSALGTGKAGYIGGVATNSTLTVGSGTFAVSMFPGFVSATAVYLTASSDPVVRLDVDVSITRNSGNNLQAFNFEIYDALSATPGSNFAVHSEVIFDPSGHVLVQDNQNAAPIDSGVTISSNENFHLAISVNYQTASWSATITNLNGGAVSVLASNRAINGSGYALSGWTSIADGWASIGCNAAVASAANNGFADRMVFDNYIVTQLNAAPPPVNFPTPPSTPYTFTTFAGKANGGSANATGPAASFEIPMGVVRDVGTGNFYVTDSGNGTIRQIDPSGAVTTFVGTPGVIGDHDDTGPAAQFSGLGAITEDGSGNLYVVDTGNLTIRKITPGGVVTTFAGTAGQPGCLDGLGTSASFVLPEGLAVDSSGNLYVADGIARVIRKITPSGEVTTFAGTPGFAGFADGQGPAARFSYPNSLAVDASDNIYVGELNDDLVRKITPTGVVTTLAGTPNVSSVTDGTGSGAFFGNIQGMTFDASSGSLFVVDDDTIRQVTLAGAVTTIAGVPGDTGDLDNSGSFARFNVPLGLAADASGNLFVADSDNCIIRKVTQAGDVTTFVGTGPYASDTNGPLATARLDIPNRVAVDGNGDVYVLDGGDQKIRKIRGGVVSDFVSYTGYEIAADRGGNVYGADFIGSKGCYEVVKFSLSGSFTQLAGGVSLGYVNGVAGAAEFGGYISAIASDPSGTVYVVDYANNAIRKITPEGNVSTFAGEAPDGTFVGGGVFASHLPFISSLAADKNGFVYANSAEGIYKIDESGNPTTLAMTEAYPGFSAYPAIAVDGVGNVFLTGQAGNIWRIDSNGLLTVIGGPAGGGPGYADGTGAAARFNSEYGLAADASGNVYVADTGNNSIRLGAIGSPAPQYASGDFNGDGQSDVLWQNASTGEVGAWLMNGPSFSSWSSTGTAPIGWQIVGTGPFDGSGNTDILWENTSTGQVGLWLMDGSSFQGWTSVATAPLGWQIVGTGSFDGTGNTDIVWENSSTGQVGVWLMNGTSYAGWNSLGTASAGWQIVGTGFFDSTGNTDILWENSSTGEVGAWLMNGTVFSSWVSMGSAAPGWQVVGTGRYDGSANTDILWENASTGQVGVWLMDGSVFSSWSSTGTASIGWQIVNH
jgi:hypothetical protein